MLAVACSRVSGTLGKIASEARYHCTRDDRGATATLYFPLICVRNPIWDTCHSSQIDGPFLACESTALGNSQVYEELCYTLEEHLEDTLQEHEKFLASRESHESFPYS